MLRPTTDACLTPLIAGTPSASAARVPTAAAEPVDSRTAALEEENLRLKAELARLREQTAANEEMPAIHFEVDKNRVEMRHVDTAGVHIEHLAVRLPESARLLDQLTLESFLAEPGKLVMPSLDPLQKDPITVEALKLSIPSETATRTANLRGKETLEKEGIRDLKLTCEPGGKIRAEGVLDRLVGVPFSVRGTLELMPDESIKFTPEKVKMFGFLPVPRLVTAVAMALQGDALKKMDVRQEGDSILIDPRSFLPDNLKVRFTRLSTEGDNLVIEGGPPRPEAPARAPRTLLAE